MTAVHKKNVGSHTRRKVTRTPAVVVHQPCTAQIFQNVLRPLKVAKNSRQVCDDEEVILLPSIFFAHAIPERLVPDLLPRMPINLVDGSNEKQVHPKSNVLVNHSPDVVREIHITL